VIKFNVWSGSNDINSSSFSWSFRLGFNSLALLCLTTIFLSAASFHYIPTSFVFVSCWSLPLWCSLPFQTVVPSLLLAVQSAACNCSLSWSLCFMSNTSVSLGVLWHHFPLYLTISGIGSGVLISYWIRSLLTDGDGGIVEYAGLMHCRVLLFFPGLLVYRLLPIPSLWIFGTSLCFLLQGHWDGAGWFSTGPPGLVTVWFWGVLSSW
jgi:hypothetical protein